MVDRGRTVLHAATSPRCGVSGRRQLRLHVDSPNRDWLLPYADVTVVRG
jgi:ABC-2 type transport system ATP-binding protein